MTASQKVGWIKERSDESTVNVLVDPLRLIHPTAYLQVRLIPSNLRALHLELFTLPFGFLSFPRFIIK